MDFCVYRKPDYLIQTNGKVDFSGRKKKYGSDKMSSGMLLDV